MEEEKIYVAVGKELKENKSTLSWALQNSGGKRVCIVHVHQPHKKIPTPLGYLSYERVEEAQLKVYRQKERQEMSAILDEYLDIAKRAGVSIEKLHMEHDCIEKGILQLIEDYNITKLVMGAAADRHYHPRKMTDLRSQKAIYVREHAPPFCHIWFVCNGYLIHTRKSISLPSSNLRENVNEGNKVLVPTAPPFNVPEPLAPRRSIDTITYDSASVSRSSSGRSDSLIESTGSQSQLLAIHHSFLQRNESAQGGRLENLYIEECKRRREVEVELAKVKEELEWVKKNGMELPRVHEEELLHMRNQVEELAKVKAEFDYFKNHVLEELRNAVEQKALLETQIGNSTFLLHMLGEKLASAINLVHNYGEQ